MAASEEQEQAMIARYKKEKAEAQSPLVKLRAYAMSYGVRGIRMIARSFRRIDENGDKKLDFIEFQQAFKEEGIDADYETIQQCFQEMDIEGNGVISFDEFLIALRPPLSDSRLQLIGQAFDKFDADGDGTVTVDDLKGVYDASFHPKFQNGEWTEEEVFQNWLENFGGGDEGVVTKEDFVNYYVGVSSSIDDDVYFDLMMRQAWRL